MKKNNICHYGHIKRKTVYVISETRNRHSESLVQCPVYIILSRLIKLRLSVVELQAARRARDRQVPVPHVMWLAWTGECMNQQYLAFCSPLPVGRRDAHGAVSIDSDTEDGVDGTEASRIIDRQPQITQQLS